MSDNEEKKAKGIAIWLFAVIALLCIIAMGMFYIKNNGSWTADNKNITAEKESSVTVTTVVTQEPIVITSVAKLELDKSELYSSNAILVRDDGLVLYEKNSQQKIYPASLTKIMTAVVALENITDPDQTVTLSQDIFDYAAAENASIAGFVPDTEITLRDLLYGLMLPSGAECSIGLAEYAGGDVDTFVDMMNAKAAELGMVNTHFTNPSGLHDDDLYSTAADIAKLESYALENPDFREIFTSPHYEAECGNGSIVTMDSTMFSAMETPEFIGGTILGGKTGFTDEAGLCLASLAEIGDHEYILVTTNAEGDHSTEQYNVIDAFTVYEAAAELYNTNS